MNKDELKARITSLVPEATFEEAGEFLNAIIFAEKTHAFLKSLREADDTAFDYLFCETCIDLPQSFDLVYHLTSTTHRHTLVVKGKITDKQNPVIDSVCDIWKTAEFHEREIFDLFGIKFNNHPDLRRIFMPDDWKGFPLRKDYVDEINMVAL